VPAALTRTRDDVAILHVSATPGARFARMTRLVLLSLFAAACGGSKPPASPQPPPPSSQAACAATAKQLIANVTADGKDRDAVKAEGAIAARCDEDHWTAESRSCMSAARTGEALDRCMATLTPEQRSKLTRAVDAALAEDSGPDELPSGP
jgi:hypothetical protein